MADLAMHKNSNTGGSIEMALFISSFLLEGLQRCSGVLFAGTLELSDESRRTASIPFAISWATAYVTSVAAKRAFQPKKTERKFILSAVLCGFGAALSFLSTNVIWLSISWGILFGAGVGVAFPESIYRSQDFRKQNLFHVLCSAAPSFGCIFLPCLIDKLIELYGVNGCLLLIAGILLNIIPLNLIQVYRISLCFCIKKWRIPKKSKKYDVTILEHTNNRPNYELKEIKISYGIQNEGYQQDSCVEMQDSKIPSNKNEALDSICSTMKENEWHSRNVITNSNNLELSSKNKNINELQQNINSESKKSINRHLFEKSFTKEDVLFEAIPEDSIIQIKPNEYKGTLTQPICTVDNNELKVGNFDEQKVNNTDTNPPVLESKNQNFLVEKPQASVDNNIRLSFPLEIKVHVVECTFTPSDIQEVQNFDRTLPNAKKHAYRRHSNSLITSCYEHIDFTSPNFLKHYGKSSHFCVHSNGATSKMYLISEDEELATDFNSVSNTNTETECNQTTQQEKQLVWQQILKKLIQPTYLVIIYSFVIYKIALITILVVFDDLANDVSNHKGTNVNIVLILFGFGGIAGRLSLRYWGDRLLIEGSHSAAAVLFILNGLVTAGVLWSPNLYWIGGFYFILGFLEIGISTSIWNLVKDYTDEKDNSILFSTCTLISGLGTLCVPYIIGLSRDDLEKYDGLLQITSCLFVLCAILCYILPRFSEHLKPHSENQIV